MAKTNQRTIGICVVLALVTLACYWPVSHHKFLNLDDHEYIYQNDHVKTGLSRDNILWAFFSTQYASNWHPLTWISHMVDCQLFGLNPGPQHLVNVSFHIADSVLLFLWLWQMTGAGWRSGFVAAFFAWHPLHVESVAWASERKDVLSTCFWLLTLMAYVRYVRNSGRGPYYLTLFLFALGLMSKPMVVTLPFVLLLLDYWPLERFSISDLRFSNEKAIPSSAPRLPSLLLEKLPFFALTVVASLMTYYAQQAATTALSGLPLKTRVANAAVAYMKYLSKAFWPVNLAPMYPYTRHLPLMEVLCAILLVAVVTALVLGQAARRPYLLMGWLWFLGTLVPTIGLVQVGSQAMADRYMYIPSIGLFIAVVWLFADWAGTGAVGRITATGLGAAVLAGCLVVTSIQVRYWRDGETLFRHAIAVTKDNYMAYDALGGALDEQGRRNEALTYYEEAVRVEPHYVEAQYNLGTLLKNLGRLAEAEEHLRAAIAADPRYAPAYVNLGSTLMKEGKSAEAGLDFIKSLKLDRDNSMGYFNLGTWLLAQGHMDDAVAAFRDAIQLKPNYEDAHGNLGVTLMRLGRSQEGMAELNEAVRLDPTNSQAYFNLGVGLLSQGQANDAVEQFEKAVVLRPDQPKVQLTLAATLGQLHRTADAISHFREALRLQPDNPEAMNGVAWIMATSSDASLRSGSEAVPLARKACDLTNNGRTDMLETLAAAYAEAGNFSDAVATAQKAIDLATTNAQAELSAKGVQMRKLFQAGQPYRDAE